MITRLEPQALEGVGELPQRRRLEGVVVALVNALRVERRGGIEEGEEQVGVEVVMGGDRPAVGMDLAEQERLDEAPCGDKRVRVLHRGAKHEGVQHVALDVDVAGDDGVADAPLVDAGDGA